MGPVVESVDGREEIFFCRDVLFAQSCPREHGVGSWDGCLVVQTCYGPRCLMFVQAFLRDVFTSSVLLLLCTLFVAAV